MKTWDLFLKDVLVHVPGCPEPVAEHAVLRAAQEYLETTRAWKLWLPDLTTEDGATDYFLLVEPKSELVRLERATLDGRGIAVRAEQDLPEDWLTYPQGVETGVHTADRKTVTLVPSQTAGLVLKVQASMKPSNSATGLDDDLFDLYVTHIAAGAVATLKGHREKSYSDPDGALLWRGTFLGHMGVTDFQRIRGYSSSRPRRRVQTF